MPQVRVGLALALAVAFFSAFPTAAEEGAEAEGVYIIFDGSGSMWGQLDDGTHKVTAARQVLDQFVGQDFGERALALRAYGHRREGDCADTELVVPFGPANDNAESIREFASKVNPKGKTPISRSLRAALDDMGERPGEIILISDGIETCDEDPCELVRSWAEKEIAIKVHVVGLGLDEKERSAMQCIAEAAGTVYQDANSADELAASLTAIREDGVEAESAEVEGTPGAPPESHWQKLTIKAATADGESMRVSGTARQDGVEPIDVTSNGHNSVPPGSWEVTVGVRTRNGNLYRPVTRTGRGRRRRFDTGRAHRRGAAVGAGDILREGRSAPRLSGDNLSGWRRGRPRAAGRRRLPRPGQLQLHCRGPMPTTSSRSTRRSTTATTRNSSSSSCRRCE